MMNIIFCADEKYLKLLPTVLNSISTNNDMSDITFHLLHNIKEEQILNRYKTYTSKKYGSKLLTYQVSKEFKYKNSLNHVTDATMLRLLIPEIINIKGTVLYLDLDIVETANISKILNLNVGHKGISGKTSIRDNVIEDMSFGEIKPNYKTLNAGVLIMDLELLRKNNFTEKCLNLLEKYSYNDQVIINLYLGGVYSELPEQYNIFNNQDDKLLLNHKEYILHFVGSQKPWICKVSNMGIWKKFEVII